MSTTVRPNIRVEFADGRSRDFKNASAYASDNTLRIEEQVEGRWVWAATFSLFHVLKWEPVE